MGPSWYWDNITNYIYIHIYIYIYFYMALNVIPAIDCEWAGTGPKVRA